MDDTTVCGDNTFAELTNKIREMFEMKEQNQDMIFL